MKNKWIVLLTAGTLLLSSCSFFPKEEELPEAPVLHIAQNAQYAQIAVSRGDLVKIEKIQCKYQSAVEETLQFSQKGEVIAHIYVQQGDSVHTGDLLAELDNTEINQSISAQQKVIQGLELQISQAKESRELLQRRISLLTSAAEEEPQVYSDSLRSARLTLSESDEQLEYLNSLLRIEKERLQELQQTLRSRQLYAGIDGTARYVLQNDSANDLISAGQTICTISDLSSASFTSLTALSCFSAGDPVTICYDDQEHEAVVQQVVSEKNGKFTVQFQLLVPDPSLTAGKQGTITMVTDTRENVLYLPQKAVISLQNVKLVYYVDENGIKNSKIVTTGLEADGKVEILDGLEEGELVIQ
ncbi:MAG: HlyD family efflux transporter periplasmic adaptor subunit [Firmicutes bacterium]|nr:HlyD family efflux transporter periplasmic adaptor subunit [Bacillota bacterium]